jgi:predicted Ser/Thr protein kinase
VSDSGQPPTRLTPELAAWLSAEIAAGGGRALGSGYQATVRVYSGPLGDVVVKRARPSRLLGALGRRLLRRELNVYERLRGIPGIPRCFGRIDDESIVLEYVAGPSLREHEALLADRDAFFGRLLETLRAMHAAGIAHGDLKRKDNILVGPDEQPYLIDFGIAVFRSSRSALLNRLVFEPIRQLDCNAWIKLKYQRRFDALSTEDAALYRPLLLERIARAVRVPWQAITLRRPRQRWRAARRREDRH